MTGRTNGRRPAVSRRAAGAVCAQFSQALGSFALQALAARTLGLDQFGVFALLVGAMVLATGLMTGFVGDSLTVLDRGQERILGALQIWCLLIAAGTLAVGALVAERTGLVSPLSALLFGVTMAVWVVEDTVRRLLMAGLRFWPVVAVDLSHLVTALAVLGMWRLTVGGLDLAAFMVALVAGQAVGVGLGMGLAPAGERALGAWRGAALRAVADFGLWRGLQQGIRPGTLTLTRVLVAVVIGRTAVGELEAARVYMAPALLFVQGVGSFLLATYAAGKDVPVRVAVGRADRAAAALVGASVVMGVVATALVGTFGPLITGGDYRIDPVAVAGWAVFSASVAAVMPYASLAAVRGRQVRVVGLRVVDAVLSLLAVGGLLAWAGPGAQYAPFGLAAGAFVGALLQRGVALGSPQPAAEVTAGQDVPAGERIRPAGRG